MLTAGDRVLGVGILVVTRDREWAHNQFYDNLSPDQKASVPEPSRPFAYFLNAAVRESYRGRGYGRRLFERRLEIARDQGATMAAGRSVDHPGVRGSAQLFEGFGFQAGPTIRVEHSDDYHCAVCGEDCRARETVYSRSF